MKAADPLLPHVLEFCLSVVADMEPLRIPCQPLAGKPFNECVVVVPEHAAANGGEQVIGWAIWERPGVFIEAEFHSVWKTPAGELVDVVPREYPFKAITFLPDPHRTYRGRQIDNVRKALVRDPDVVRFLFLAKRKTQILNEGHLADKYDITLDELSPRQRREILNLIDEGTKLEARLNKRYGACLPNG